ncbi:serine/arginine repetitive matrix protein 1-like isoform X2 [Frankliniella occidentalis]|uniref:Serine/arginine repetitive matrix protein 1-like isoform X2 n=1 Tax=Frankliniella occidentalis TaxID=133901 RepID=A0A9C6UB31_FRAOC|nr:serine/arginine repetitive matrix protein 1-like isoform X2 [Frankliniella occidentalis]
MATYPCLICPLGFFNHLEAQLHMRTHLNANPFRCMRCGDRFGTASELCIHDKLNHKHQDQKEADQVIARNRCPSAPPDYVPLDDDGSQPQARRGRRKQQLSGDQDEPARGRAPKRAAAARSSQRGSPRPKRARRGASPARPQREVSARPRPEVRRKAGAGRTSRTSTTTTGAEKPPVKRRGRSSLKDVADLSVDSGLGETPSVKRWSAPSRLASLRTPTTRKSTPTKTTPRKTAPRESTPRKSTPRRYTPRKSTPRKSTPRKSIPRKTSARKGTPPKRKASPQKTGVQAGQAAGAAPPRKRGRPRKASPRKAAPQKASQGTSTTAKNTTGQKASPKRATPRRATLRSSTGATSISSPSSTPRKTAPRRSYSRKSTTPIQEQGAGAPLPKKRGRPRREPAVDQATIPPKKRGRPRRQPGDQPPAAGAGQSPGPEVDRKKPVPVYELLDRLTASLDSTSPGELFKSPEKPKKNRKFKEAPPPPRRCESACSLGRPFACNVCGRRFSQEMSLLYHNVYHS